MNSVSRTIEEREGPPCRGTYLDVSSGWSANWRDRRDIEIAAIWVFDFSILLVL